MLSNPLLTIQLSPAQTDPHQPQPPNQPPRRPWRTPALERLACVETRAEHTLPGAFGFASFPSP
jgi:hypothetical protein